MPRPIGRIPEILDAITGICDAMKGAGPPPPVKRPVIRKTLGFSQTNLSKRRRALWNDATSGSTCTADALWYSPWTRLARSCRQFGYPTIRRHVDRRAEAGHGADVAFEATHGWYWLADQLTARDTTCTWPIRSGCGA